MQTEREERPTAGGNRFGGGSRQPLGSPLAAGSRYAARPLRARGLAIGIDIGGTKVAAGVVVVPCIYLMQRRNFMGAMQLWQGTYVLL